MEQVLTHYTHTLALSFGFCLIGTYLTVHLAKRFDIYSPIDFRRNGRQIPLLGGVPIFISIFSVGFLFDTNYTLLVFLSALPLLVAGFWDDIKELPAKPKFLAQLMAAAIFLIVYPREELFLIQQGFPAFWAYTLSFFWIVGLCNAVNFIDGIDGQATSYGLLVLGALFLSSSPGSTNDFLLIAVGAYAAFLAFNFPPASIFLGDIGSISTGFLIGIVQVSFAPKNPEAFNVLGILFLASLPLTDLILSVARRLSKSLTPFVGDKDHIHHKLQKVGFSRFSSLGISSGVVLFCALSHFTLTRITDSMIGPLLGVLFTTALMSVLGFVYYIEFQLGNQVSRYSKTVIHKHLAFDTTLNIDYSNYQAILIDLFPYYKELQRHGFPTVDKFIHEFSVILNKYRDSCTQLGGVGTYSVILVNSGVNINLKRKGLEKEFFGLTEKFGVVKNSTRRPDGFYYYNRRNKKQFQRIMNWSKNSPQKTMKTAS